MSDVTILLDRWSRGDPDAHGELLTLLYDELRVLASRSLQGEREGHTLQPTALVHELYLRLDGLRDLRFENRRHFYGAAAGTMRRILVDHARQRRARKRGGADAVRVDITDLDRLTAGEQPDYEALDEALNRLSTIAPEQARVVDLRYFAGLSIEEMAEVLDLSPATVKRHWAFARAWLYEALRPQEGSRPGGNL